MECALYGIYALVFVSEIEGVSAANEWDCFCIRNLTRSLRSLVRFLIRQQLVCKCRSPALSMKFSICILIVYWCLWCTLGVYKVYTRCIRAIYNVYIGVDKAYTRCIRGVYRVYTTNYSSSPNGLWVNSRRPNGLLTQRPWGREE